MIGWQVGSDPEIQVATIVSNHLTAGIFKYFGDSGRWGHAANLFEKLAAREPEVSCTELYWHEQGSRSSTDAGHRDGADSTVIPLTVLHTQCDFLRSKGKNEWALKLACQAVNCAPSEFVTGENYGYLYRSRGVRVGAPHAQLMSNVHVQCAGRTPQPLCVATVNVRTRRMTVSVHVNFRPPILERHVASSFPTGRCVWESSVPCVCFASISFSSMLRSTVCA